ncbi:NAD(P)-dependent oxidoreductase [Coraliomargarita sp. SDUM461004]|uniref:NAD(P)-dependent oxidoreductase n=1 Tax=Thalassobacterium sedimentorum TaxID=3041258 RepID=A0ABU1AHD5_9BACT|nr:NAD(P)-dependent oxidoreductase [Coraliomargarita sp. SDUM461004]MDQ8193285.1 NAD(P)-dependent oxidoreductase [Coraliomargarita sp. SDUM461004]
MMKYWKNTATIDRLVPELLHTVGAAEAEIAVIGSQPIDVSKMPKLKGIFKCGVGTDNVPFDAAKARGIEICMPSEHTKRYIFEETANFAVYLIFRMLFSDIGEVDAWVKQSRGFLGDKKVLIIGQGNIGSHVVRKLAPSVEVLTFDVLYNQMNELHDLVRQADVLSLHIPLLSATKGFIDAEKLSWMQDGAALVNTARGPVVDEEALYQEIETGRLRAAFDVFWEEPYAGKLKAFHPHRFLMSPHVSSNCEDFLSGLAVDFRAFVNRFED